ncbi:MAG: hydratase [Desulfovibrio sp.]|nr:hydratase [Desulfovibrio sp.]
MIEIINEPVVVADEKLYRAREGKSANISASDEATIARRIFKAHNKSAVPGKLEISFDCLVSHDITYVGIIQTAIASGLKKFPVPYILTNCHNSLCAVGGTINEDDHVFGLSAAEKFGGIFVPPHLAVIHQYIREMEAKCGGMILGSDSHTRYGALGTLGVGEGGPELVKQLLGQTWNLDLPETILIWLEGKPKPGVGPQDVALALIRTVFKSGFVKNKTLEFGGPGVANLSMDFRNGVDVMTTETACLTSIWPTDEKTKEWMIIHGRKDDYKELKVVSPASYDGCVRIDLNSVESMIALPFHPSNVYTIREFTANAGEILGEAEAEAEKLFGTVAKNLRLKEKISGRGVKADQGIIAGCAGGTFENISAAAAVFERGANNNLSFTFDVYPASVPVASALMSDGITEALLSRGAIWKTSFCGPCFGAGDTPANGALSIRHTTRNFPNREGSKPGDGQICAVALMDARSIAASAVNGGIITAADGLDWDKIRPDPFFRFNPSAYENRVYNGYGKADMEKELITGPNISEWPDMPPLPEHLILEICGVILDPVTTTDELIPSGETSSLRSNPKKLAEYTLSRKDPGYVGRAKAILAEEEERAKDPENAELVAKVEKLIGYCSKQPVAEQIEIGPDFLKYTGLGSVIYANKPGDGSAREQAASCQKVLGGWANLAREYATKRYRSNLINWGVIPFLVGPDIGKDLQVGDYLIIPHIRSYVYNGAPEILCALLHMNKDESKIWSEQIALFLHGLTEEERKILMAGSLINYNKEKSSQD